MLQIFREISLTEVQIVNSCCVKCIITQIRQTGQFTGPCGIAEIPRNSLLVKAAAGSRGLTIAYYSRSTRSIQRMLMKMFAMKRKVDGHYSTGHSAQSPPPDQAMMDPTTGR